jgi:hypothetical protein
MGRTLIAISTLALLIGTSAHGLQITISGPTGSGSFGGGNGVLRLPNGNIVVADPLFDLSATLTDVGAVYLYNPQGQLISSLTGTSVAENVGSDLWLLPNGDALVRGNGANGAGTLTKLDRNIGLSGVVNAANSLRGLVAGDFASVNVTALTNGKVVLRMPLINNGGVADVGAARLWDPTTPLPSVLNETNALFGFYQNDQVGSDVVPLTNGNYVVVCRDCDTAFGNQDVGAVVFGRGDTGRIGKVSFSIAFMGTTGTTVPDRFPGNDGKVVALPNGHYLVIAPQADVAHDGEIQTDGGAVTFVNGTTGLAGAVPSSSNSLVGLFRGTATGGDKIGSSGVTILSNGNYVVASPSWGAMDEGAATWCSGTSGRTGVVDTDNSIYGTKISDKVGIGNLRFLDSGVTALSGGHYVVSSPLWGLPTDRDVGAATWGNGITGSIGPVTTSNSLIGGSSGDQVGKHILALPNGNYVVGSPNWFHASTQRFVGAATFSLGNGSTVGLVSANNSLVGVNNNDQVGANLRSLNVPGPLYAEVGELRIDDGSLPTAERVADSRLTSGNVHYLAISPSFDSATGTNVGAVTWGSGVTGINGPVSVNNSLLGSASGDQLGLCSFVLAGGNYVAIASGFDVGLLSDAGAAVFSSGNAGMTGILSQFNSAYGQFTNNNLDYSCFRGATFDNGNYLLSANYLNNRGSLTWGNGVSGLLGPIGAQNSIVGTVDNETLYVSTTLADNTFVVTNYVGSFVSLVSSAGPIAGTASSLNTVLGSELQRVFARPHNYDLTRKQLVVQQPSLNRIILLQPGAATAMASLQGAPNPSVLDQTVGFSVQVSSTTAPTDGRVLFQSSSGEQCVDTTPTVINSTTSSFACSIAFSSPGVRQITSSYFGSDAFAAASSSAISHVVLAGDIILKTGFE